MTWRDPYEGRLDGVEAGCPLRRRRLFSGWADYADDRLVWVSVKGRGPWRGILVPTERAYHATLRASLPARRPDFEAVAGALAQRIADGDALPYLDVPGGGR